MSWWILDNDFPFLNILLHCNPISEEPAYLVDQITDIKCIMNDNRSITINHAIVNDWNNVNKEKLKLNTNQYDAFKLILLI